MEGEFSAGGLVARLSAFSVRDVADVSRYGSGHINDTFKVETRGGPRYVLQRVNTSIFGDLAMLERNIRLTTRHIAAKGGRTLEVAGYDGAWRLYAFVEGCVSKDVVETPSDAGAAAAAFAAFQNALADLPPEDIGEILPRFHDTPDRMRQLDEAASRDAVSRAASVARELDFVDSMREKASLLARMASAGEIPRRIAHNDSKINNVLVPSGGGEAVVIDLDTVMPGTVLSDFGDLVRTATAAAAEDERDLSKVFTRRDCFEALARGYLGAAHFLVPAERENLVYAGWLSTFEVGVKFLTDYLAGDVYFKTAYPEHNLVRARNQFKMASSIEDARDEYERIVRSVPPE